MCHVRCLIHLEASAGRIDDAMDQRKILHWSILHRLLPCHRSHPSLSSVCDTHCVYYGRKTAFTQCELIHFLSCHPVRISRPCVRRARSHRGLRPRLSALSYLPRSSRFPADLFPSISRRFILPKYMAENISEKILLKAAHHPHRQATTERDRLQLIAIQTASVELKVRLRQLIVVWIESNRKIRKAHLNHNFLVGPNRKAGKRCEFRWKMVIANWSNALRLLRDL